MSRLARVSLLLVMAFAVLAPAGGARAQSAKTQLKDPELAQRFNEVSDRLVCQCGCMMIVRVCNHQNCPSAIPIRREIERRLEAGETDDEIVQSFVDEHGLKVLSAPPAEGVNIAAWVMPGVAVLMGLLIVLYVARGWVRTHRTAAVDAPPVEIDPAVRSRIEDELKGSDR